MKKILTVIIIFLVGISALTAEKFDPLKEIGPITIKKVVVTGYNGMEFGSTIEDVWKKYPDLYPIANLDGESNVTIYASGKDMGYSSERGIIRIFKFVNTDFDEKKGKLYEVIVNYQNYETLYINDVKKKIESDFNGEWQPLSSKTSNSDGKQEILCFWINSIKKYVNPIKQTNKNDTLAMLDAMGIPNTVIYNTRKLRNKYGVEAGTLNQFIYTSANLQHLVKTDVEL